MGIKLRSARRRLGRNREVLTCGLYDRHTVGGRAWAIRSFSRVCTSLACVPGDVLHLYHGSRPNRQYVERYNILHENAFDPGRDVEIDPETGLLRWSDVARTRKPDLVRRVAAYFAGRREDE